MDLRWHIMVFDGSRRSIFWLLKPEVAVQLFLQAICYPNGTFTNPLAADFFLSG